MAWKKAKCQFNEEEPALSPINPHRHAKASDLWTAFLSVLLADLTDYIAILLAGIILFFSGALRDSGEQAKEDKSAKI